MKPKTVIMLAGGAAVGYVLGTAAGRARFEQLKSQADKLVHDPKVQQAVADVAGQVKENAHYIPSPLASVVGTAAGHLQETLKKSPPDSDTTISGSS